MKIRKLTIKNYKLFENEELDFTNENGQTLDTIVLAGINGSGKTSLLELLKAIFSTQPENKPSHAYFLKDSQIKLELEIPSHTEKDQFLNVIRPEELKISRNSPEHSASLEIMGLLINYLKKELLNPNPILTLWYKAERRDNQTVIQQNDFMLFEWLSKAGIDLKLYYIPAETYLNGAV